MFTRGVSGTPSLPCHSEVDGVVEYDTVTVAGVW